jgi:hypothetical protein
MRNISLVIFVCLSLMSFSQKRKGQTSVIKVRAGLAKCEIITEEKFLLEKESDVTIKVKGRNPQIDVRVKGCEIRSVKGDVYHLRFTNPGISVIWVYQVTDKGRKLIGIKKTDVVPPPFYFCGLKLDSASKVLKLGKVQLYAYSDHYKAKLPVNKFYMLYYKDFFLKGRQNPKPIVDTLRSDTCKLTKEMRNRLKYFQPKSDKIYFYNLYFTLPDKTIRPLEPVELQAGMDTVANDYSVIYFLRRKPV